MNEPLEFFPEARRDGIIRKEVDGELLIYDLRRDKAHCLNASAAAILKRCDGRTSTEEIARSLAEEVGANVDVTVVWLAVADLRRTHLLEEPRETEQSTDAKSLRIKNRKGGQWPQAILGMSRREAVKRIGLGAAIALPVIISITSPTPAMANSCLHAGAGCNTGAECCSGSCTGMNGTCIGG